MSYCLQVVAHNFGGWPALTTLYLIHAILYRQLSKLLKRAKPCLDECLAATASADDGGSSHRRASVPAHLLASATGRLMCNAGVQYRVGYLLQSPTDKQDKTTTNKNIYIYIYIYAVVRRTAGGRGDTTYFPIIKSLLSSKNYSFYV